MKYLKVWTDFETILAPLTDAEKGRLFVAMLHYAGTGEEPAEFAGNESFLWAVAKRDIDKTAERDETYRQNGMKGGRPKTKQNQTEPNETFGSEEEPNETLKEKKRKEKKGNEKKRNESSSSFIDDDAAHEIQGEQDRVLDAAEDAGFLKSNSVRAKLLNLYAQYGLEKMLNAFDSCVKHSAPTIAYLEAVLKDAPRKQKPKVTAQDYEQRDYSGVQDTILDEQAREIEAKLKRKAAAG